MRLGHSPVFAGQLPRIHEVSPTSLNTTLSAFQSLSMQTSPFQIRLLFSLYPTVFLKLFWLFTPEFASAEQQLCTKVPLSSQARWFSHSLWELLWHHIFVRAECRQCARRKTGWGWEMEEWGGEGRIKRDCQKWKSTTSTNAPFPFPRATPVIFFS